jgi:hypothetical protein
MGADTRKEIRELMLGTHKPKDDTLPSKKFPGIPKRAGIQMSRHRQEHVTEHCNMMSWLGKPPFPNVDLEV